MKPGPWRMLHLVLVRFWSAIAWNSVSIAKSLAARGHICWIAGAEGSPIMREAPLGGIRLADELRLHWLRPWNWAGTIATLHRFLVAHRIDIAFVHTGSGHLELHLARRGLPVALVRVRADPRRPRGGAGQRWLYLHGAERVVMSGAYMLDGCPAQLRHRRGHLQQLPPGIDLAGIEGDPSLERASARAAIGERYRLASDLPLIGIVGRLSPVKGHELLIRAAGMLAERGCDFRLLIIGAEKEVSVETLRRQAAALGLESRLVFAGFVEDPLRHAAALDIGVIPSLGSEAVSRSALEFMALGVPVLASRVGILPEVVAQEELLVPPGDAGQLAATLAALLEDPARSRRLGEAGRERVRARYSLEVLGERAERVALEALELRLGSIRQ